MALDYTNKLVKVDDIHNIKEKSPYLLAVNANVPNAQPSIIDLVSVYVNYALDSPSIDHSESLVNISSFLDELDVFQSTNNGYQGYQGRRGKSGVQGPQGIQGLKGADPPAEAGIQGYTGSQGVQGRKGLQGYQGYQGLQGQMGPQPTDTAARNKLINIFRAQGITLDSNRYIICQSIVCAQDICAAQGFYQINLINYI